MIWKVQHMATATVFVSTKNNWLLASFSFDAARWCAEMNTTIFFSPEDEIDVELKTKITEICTPGVNKTGR